jgi:hypothetical protein
MSVQFGSVQSGFSVSSTVSLGRANRTVYIQVASYGAQGWFAAFANNGGPYARPVLDGAAFGVAYPVWTGTAGGWGLVPYPPTATMRVEAASNVTATVSFCVVEVPRYG